MSERLEEIKSRVWKEKGTYAMGDDGSREGYSYTLSDYDFEWLIQQAERVEELEEKVKQYEKALDGFNKEFNFEYRWQKSNVKRNPKSQWQRGTLEGFEHVKRIYDKHVEVQND